MNDQEIWPYDARKLLRGERVEVRQKEKGLRGSWHPATIVGLKPGRRLVEYDELLTEDGLHKLRESIPVTRSSETMRGSACRTTFSPRRNEAFRNTPRRTLLSPQPKSRGFLRPLPPRCTELSPQSWKRGFMVDVFFQDAWWEAVLLEDVVSLRDDALINVMFPDEGDEERISVKNSRISQEWDEDTGQWSVKGACNVSEFLRRGGLGSKKMAPSDQNKSSDVIKRNDGSVSDAEIKDCRAERDQGCPASSCKIQEGSEAERGEYCQAPVDNIQDVSGAPANVEGIGGESMGGQQATLVKRLSFTDCANKEDDINQEPVQVTCLEHYGDVPPSMPSLHVSNGLSGAKGVGSCRKEDDPVENLELRVDTVIPENAERCFDVDGFRDAMKDGRKESDECIFGDGTFEVLPRKALIKADIQPESGGRGAEACCSRHKQGLESVNSPQPVTVTSLQKPVDDAYQTNVLEELGFGKAQCPGEFSSSIQSNIKVQNREESSAKETDAEAHFCSPSPFQEGDPLIVQRPVVRDEAAGKKKVGRLSKDTEGIDSREILLKSDRLGKMKASSKEERLRRGLMRIEIPSCKSRMRLGGSSPKLTTKVRGVTEENNSIKDEDAEGLDSLKELGRRDGIQRPFNDKLVTDDLKGKGIIMGGEDKTDKVLDTLRHCSKLVNTEGTKGFFKNDPKSEKKPPRVSLLKNVVREITKAALAEVGFRVEFRPRKTKDYQDAVYVSPQGHTYWSLPNAWRAWKRSQSLEGNIISPQPGLTGAAPSVRSSTGSGSCRHGGKGSPGAKVGDKWQDFCGADRGYRTPPAVRSDQDVLLQAALEQVGTVSAGDMDISKDDLKQLHLTNSQLADLFVGDFNVLKKTINKRAKGAKRTMNSASAKIPENKGLELKNGVIAKTSKHSLAEFVNESGGKKRKRDSQSSMDKANKKIPGRKFSFSREQPEYGASSDKSWPHKRGLVLKKSGKVLKDIGPPRRLESRLLVKPRLLGFSSKKSGSKHLEEKKPLVKRVKSGKRPNSDGENGFECERLAKKSRGTPKEKTLADSILTKKQRVLLQRSSPLCQLEGKKSKVIPCKQLVLHNRKGKNQKGRSGLRLEVRATASRKSDGSDASLFSSKQTILSWMIDRGVVLEKEKLSYMDRENNQVLKKGLVSHEGILCSCCKRIYTICNFEVHAGSHAGRPGRNIIFASGRSLMDCQQQAWAVETQLRKTQNYVGVTLDDRNDDTCLLCGDGGDLLCCDHCPSTFHTSCLQLQNVPEGEWYCPKCSCAVCVGSQHNNGEKDLATKEMLSCSQCEHRYHSPCLNGGSIVAGSESFCGKSCQKIFSGLRNLIGISHPLDRGFSWTLLRCMEADWESPSPESVEATAEQHSKLAVALLVMQECFVPMEDPRTNIDMITHVLYNRWSEFDRLNYGGFYTAILEREDEIISAASIRVHGALLAEMPLIGTRQQYRRQGMCRLLVGEIEKILKSLEVATFVLPAIPELLDTWTYAFGFKPLDASQRLKNRDLSMMVFPGTQLLQKPLSGINKVDTLSTENLISQKSDSSLEILQSDAAPAKGLKDAEICHTMLRTSISSSDVLECKKDVLNVVDCAASRSDLHVSESERDLERQSCTKGQGLEVTWLSKGDGSLVPCELADISNLCIVEEARIQSNGLPEENQQCRIEATHPDNVLSLNGESNCLETSSEKVQPGLTFQEDSHVDLNSLGLFNGLASSGKTISAGESQKMLRPLSERISNVISVCEEKQLNVSVEEMGAKSTCTEDPVSNHCPTSVDEELFKMETQQDSEGMSMQRVEDLFAAPRLDRYLSQTYGRKRWRQVGNANSPLGNQVKCDTLVLSTTKASMAIDEADVMSSVCLDFDKKHLSHDSGTCQLE